MYFLRALLRTTSPCTWAAVWAAAWAPDGTRGADGHKLDAMGLNVGQVGHNVGHNDGTRGTDGTQCWTYGTQCGTRPDTMWDTTGSDGTQQVHMGHNMGHNVGHNMGSDGLDDFSFMQRGARHFQARRFTTSPRKV